MKGEKVLVTGATGQVGLPIARALAADKDVWAVARFQGSAEGSRPLRGRYSVGAGSGRAEGRGRPLPTDGPH